MGSLGNTPSAATSPAFRIAEQWYFDLLRAELRVRGQPEAAGYLPHYLRLVPAPGEAAETAAGRIALSLQQRLTECEVRLNSQTGQAISWFVDFLSEHGDTSMPQEEALQLAARIAGLPDGAELECAGYESMADRTFFRARWIHRYQGLEVEGDYIEVLINGAAQKAFSVNRVWREPNLTSIPMVR